MIKYYHYIGGVKIKRELLLFIAICSLFICLQMVEPAYAATNTFKKIDYGNTASVQHMKFSVKFGCKYSYLGTKVFPVTIIQKFSWNTYQNNNGQVNVRATEYTQAGISSVKGVPSEVMTSIRKQNEFKRIVQYNTNIYGYGGYLYAMQTVNGKKQPLMRMKVNLTPEQYYFRYIRYQFKHWFS